MLKLLIADDEPLVRNGLAYGFDWAQYDVEIVGTACNGKEAIVYIEERTPDIVITDIKMPEMDGLELAAWIRANYPETEVIFLTGYSEFALAKRAIELDAASYLLKPVEEKELLEVLGEIRCSLNTRNKKEEQYRMAMETLKANMPVLREKFLEDVLKGKMKEEEILHNAGFYGLDVLRRKYFAVSKIEFYHRDTETGTSISDLEIEKERLLTILKELLRGFEACIVREGADFATVIFAFATEGEEAAAAPDRSYLAAVERLNRFKLPEMSELFSITMGVSDLKEGAGNLSRCFYEAGEALSSKVYMGKNNVILYSELVRDGTQVFNKINKEKLQRLILEGDKDGLHAYAGEYFSFYRVNPLALKKYKLLVVFEVVSAAGEILAAYGSGNMTLSDYSFITELTGSETLDDLCSRMCTFFEMCISDIENRRNSHTMVVLEKIIAYLRENYSRDINLKTISSEFSVNSSYLSRIFSARTGLPFTDYLNDLRMERARELLRATELGVGVIARNVGYVNERYFSRLFKKREGMTPQEYRNAKR